MKRTLMSSVMIVALLALVGCETSKGVGKDMENTGKNIQEGIERN